jgi:hypothetical protein
MLEDGRVVALDPPEVELVDRDAVKLLVLTEASGIDSGIAPPTSCCCGVRSPSGRRQQSQQGMLGSRRSEACLLPSVWPPASCRCCDALEALDPSQEWLQHGNIDEH